MGTQDGSRHPAGVVSQFHRLEHLFSMEDSLSDLREARLWVSGYDMDNMKPRGYVESTIPLIAIEDEVRRERARTVLTNASSGANLVRLYLVSALKEAWFARPADTRGSFSFAERAFWREGEPAYAALLHASLRENADPAQLREEWLGKLRRQCLTLFDRLALSANPEQENLARLSRARINLTKKLYGPKLRSDLGLAQPTIQQKEEAS